MSIERFLNHIYYSYAAIDRMLSFNPINPHRMKNQDIVASKLMGLAIAGYMIGLLYLLIICPMRLFGIYIVKLDAFLLISPLLVLGLGFTLGKFLAPPVYTKYFKEFRENNDYDTLTWNLIAILFFIGSMGFFLCTISNI